MLADRLAQIGLQRPGFDVCVRVVEEPDAGMPPPPSTSHVGGTSRAWATSSIAWANIGTYGRPESPEAVVTGAALADVDVGPHAEHGAEVGDLAAAGLAPCPPVRPRRVRWLCRYTAESRGSG